MSTAAWGLALFQSDYDYDIISSLNRQANIWDLERDEALQLNLIPVYTTAITSVGNDEAEPEAVRRIEHDRVDQFKIQRSRKEIYYSIYSGLCSHSARIKKFLEEDERVEVLIAECIHAAADPKAQEQRPQYILVILGACLISLGCKYPLSFHEHLRKIYASVGLMRDGLAQMETALFGPHGYTMGTPYTFSGSKGIEATMASGGPAVGDRYMSTLPDVPSPCGVLGRDAMRAAMGTEVFEDVATMVQCMMRVYEAAKGKSTRKDLLVACGGCRAEDGLVGSCGKCKVQKYCGAECQKKDWGKHKLQCTKMAAAKVTQIEEKGE